MKLKMFLLSISFIPLYFIYNSQNNLNINDFSKKIISCAENNNLTVTISCTKGLLRTNLDLIEFKGLISIVNRESSENIEFSKFCHDIAHVIGEEAYVQHKDRALIKNLESCGEGFMHGVMSKFQSSESGVLKLISYCEDLPRNTELSNVVDINIDLNDLCYHGIGHTFGASFIIDENNIDFIRKEFLNKNYNFCVNVFNIVKDKFSISSENIISNCFYGGYDEFSYNYYQYIGKNLVVDNFISNEFLNDCNFIDDEKTLSYCYRITTIYQLNLMGRSFKNLSETNKLVNDVSNFCKSLSSKAYIIGCIEGISVFYIHDLFSDKQFIEELVKQPNKIINYLDTACQFDIDNRCRITFTNELKVKLNSSLYDEIMSIL